MPVGDFAKAIMYIKKNIISKTADGKIRWL